MREYEQCLGLNSFIIFFNSLYAFLSEKKLGVRFISLRIFALTPYSSNICIESASVFSGAPPTRIVSYLSESFFVKKTALYVGPPILNRLIILRTRIFFLYA